MHINIPDNASLYKIVIEKVIEMEDGRWNRSSCKEENLMGAESTSSYERD